MREVEQLYIFMERTRGDCRINRGHMALYIALFDLWRLQQFSSPLRFFGAELMPVAKISSSATFHRLIRELNEFGYIRYQPSFYKYRQSEVWMN